MRGELQTDSMGQQGGGSVHQQPEDAVEAEDIGKGQQPGWHSPRLLAVDLENRDDDGEQEDFGKANSNPPAHPSFELLRDPGARGHATQLRFEEEEADGIFEFRRGLSGKLNINANCSGPQSLAASGPLPKTSPMTLKLASQSSMNIEIAQLMTSESGSKARGAAAKRASKGRVEAAAAATRR